MNAKELNTTQEIQNILDRNFTRGDNAKALNELLILFQAKSKEEASDNYMEALVLIPKDLNAYIVAEIDQALRLAAFGKEGEE